jgi:hypothetical protein
MKIPSMVLWWWMTGLLVAPVWAQTSPPGSLGPLTPIDISTSTASQAPDTFVAPAQRDAASELEQRIPGLEIQWNPLTGTPRLIQSRTNLLTAPQLNVDPVEVLRGFVRDNLALFGFSTDDLSTLTVSRQTGGNCPALC